MANVRNKHSPNKIGTQKLWKFRSATGLHLCFTLDAGANVHLLYPKAEKEAILAFIKDTLSAYCENQSYICDEVGSGPEKSVPL